MYNTIIIIIIILIINVVYFHCPEKNGKGLLEICGSIFQKEPKIGVCGRTAVKIQQWYTIHISQRKKPNGKTMLEVRIHLNSKIILF